LPSSNCPELVISDYSMPEFNGLRAAQLLRERHPDIPFILISGTVGEDIAVEAMKQGATDYLLKDRIARLGKAVHQALEQKRLQKERLQLERQLILQATALETAANGMAITDPTGKILWVNPCAGGGHGVFRKRTDWPEFPPR
jgi:DNA-binding NtrC family response regulator